MLAAPTFAQLPGTGWQLRFADEFNRSSLDTMKWNYNYPWGNTHNDNTYESPANVTVNSGLLNLTAYRDTSFAGKSFSSGAINTSGLLNVTYGYIESREKMPQTVGTWPAFWMLQNGWPPEIDIQEVPESSYDDMYNYWTTYHYTNSSGNPASYGSGRHYAGFDLSADFHNYGVDWEPTYMKFYLDGTLINTVTDTSAISQSAAMYLILNLAVGGWPGDPPSWASFPTSFQTDWVRVWQKPTATLRSTFTHTGNGNQNWDAAGNWNNGSPQVGAEEAFFGPLAGTTDVRLDWNIGSSGSSRTVGSLTFQSSTNYTIGWPNKSLMLADAGGTSYINGYYQSGQGIMAISSRLELYNNTEIHNFLNNPISLNGDIVGTGQLSVMYGGATINGNATYTGATIVSNSGNLTVNGPISATPNFWISTGSATINSGGTVSTSGFSSIGYATDTSGTLNVNGGLLSVNGDLNAADVAGSRGLLKIGSGKIQAATLFIGKYGTASGTLTQSGGSVTNIPGGGEWRIGGAGSASDAAAVGIYNLSGGTLATSTNLQVGAYGRGTVTQTGGSANVSGYLSIGRYGGGVGTYDLSSGSGTLTANAQPFLIVAESGNGTLLVGGSSTVNAQSLAISYNGGTGIGTQTGGTVNAPTGLVLGRTGGSGIYTLSGGSLAVGSITRGTGSGTFNFHGGTLRATADNATFLQGLSTANVQNGGATIDTNGHWITIAQSLLASGSGGLTKTGSGLLTLTGTNTYTGKTLLTGGSLGAANNFSLGSGSAVSMAGANATLILANSFSSAKGLIVPSGQTANLEVDNADSATWSGAISGGGSGGFVAKLGSGTLVVKAASTPLANTHAVWVRGGTLLIDSGGSLTVSNAWQDVAASTGDNATLTLRGNATFSSTDASDFNLADSGGTGTVNVGGSALFAVGNLYIGKDNANNAASTGIFNQSGGSVTVRNVFQLGTNSHGVGTYILSGGSLTSSVPITRGTGSGTFKFNGGTLRAGASMPNFLQGLSSAYVQNGGAVIDTNGYNATIAQSLLASGSGGLTKLGAGTLILSGPASTFTGGITISGGSLIFASNRVSADGSSMSIAAGGTLILDSASASGPAIDVQAEPVPEPSSLMLLLAAAVGIAGIFRSRSRARRI